MPRGRIESRCNCLEAAAQLNEWPRWPRCRTEVTVMLVAVLIRRHAGSHHAPYEIGTTALTLWTGPPITNWVYFCTHPCWLIVALRICTKCSNGTDTYPLVWTAHPFSGANFLSMDSPSREKITLQTNCVGLKSLSYKAHRNSGNTKENQFLPVAVAAEQSSIRL